MNLRSGKKLIGEINFSVHEENIHIRSLYLIDEFKGNKLMTRIILNYLNKIGNFGIKTCTLVSPEHRKLMYKSIGFNEQDELMIKELR